MTKGNTLKQKKSAILEGIIIPTAWDGKGHSTKFSLFTFDEREYKIDPGHSKNIDISAFIRKKIRLTYRWDREKEWAKYIILEDICEINRLNE